MANPFHSSQNPFENDLSGDGNPFEDSIDDIVIPGLDDDLDVIVSNPFRGESSVFQSCEKDSFQMLHDDSGREFEAKKIIDNVNLTFRARSDEAIISTISSDYFNLSTFDIVSPLLSQITQDPELKRFKNLITRVAELKAQLKAIERRLAQKIQSNEAAYKKHQTEIETLHESLINTTIQFAQCRNRIKLLKQNTEMPLLILHKEIGITF